MNERERVEGMLMEEMSVVKVVLVLFEKDLEKKFREFENVVSKYVKFEFLYIEFLIRESVVKEANSKFE